MHRIICSRFNIFRKYFTKNSNKNNIGKNNVNKNNSSENYLSNSEQNENEILFTNINQLMKNDFQNIYEKLELMDNKIKIINEKTELILSGISGIENDMRKSEEIVLINN